MFIRRLIHITEVKRLESIAENLQRQLEMLHDIHSQRCAMYEARIDDLKRLVFVTESKTSPELLEVDAVISGSEKPVEMSEEERSQILQGERELDLLISGNYDVDLLQ